MIKRLIKIILFIPVLVIESVFIGYLILRWFVTGKNFIEEGFSFLSNLIEW